jgi:glycosyltransferase A (GT-A) superfamily protein (DUF2064 family)
LQAELNNTRKILLYAPPTLQGLEGMKSILDSLESETKTDWTLIPMLSRDLQSSHLGHLLTDALVRVREIQSNVPVMFLGMDSPEVPLDEVVHAIHSTPAVATLCPAGDGGYGMLCVPSNTDAKQVFEGVRWSNSLTALSQLKALTDMNVPVRLGRLMHDIDTPDDVQALVDRLKQSSDNIRASLPGDEVDVLTRSTFPAGPRECNCSYTRKTLEELGLL